MGLGETLSLNSQLGTRQDNVTLGFTEPYFLDRPIQVGATVFYTRFDYNQAREASILAGQNLTQLFNELGSQNLLNYVTNSRGFTAFVSKPLRQQLRARRAELRLLDSERDDVDERGDGVLHLHRLPAHQRAESFKRH